MGFKDIQLKKTYDHNIVKVVIALFLMVTLVGCGSRVNDEIPLEETLKETSETSEVAKQNSGEIPITVPENNELNPVELVAPIWLEQSYPAYLDTNNLVQSDPVRAIYISGHVAGIDSWMDKFIQLADETELNAFVIDVKNDSGRIMFDMDLPLVKETGAAINTIKDIDGLMQRLYEHDIFPIARIVAFKDPFMPLKRTDYAIKNQDGSLFYYHGAPWLNPYDQDVWDYVIDVAIEAAKVGFKEIQFDYIRFEATYRMNDADFGPIDPDMTKKDVIVAFLEYANEALAPYNVLISADVFGTIITSEVDARLIGQDYLRMAEHLDVICPMVYPSHYAKGSYGTPHSSHPDHYPYEIIYGSMMDSNKVLANMPGERQVIVRPWLQAFTASYLRAPNYKVYTYATIREQIQAVYDAGLTEWILWNAGNVYPEAAFLKNEE